MPIRPELRHFYAGPEWQITRARILKRAGNCCERCGRPNRRDVTTVRDGTGRWYDLTEARWKDAAGEPCEAPYKRMLWRSRVVLTIAHLDFDPSNNDDANLLALCQHCHLKHDCGQHAHNRRRSRATEFRQCWILPELADTIPAVVIPFPKPQTETDAPRTDHQTHQQRPAEPEKPLD